MSYRQKLLIVDDEEDFCFLVKKNLEATGEFQVFVAHNGKDGIVLAQVEKPNVIILDILMPAMQGGEVAELLRQDPSTKDIPIIFLTAIIRKEEVGEEPMRHIGPNKYIAKPIETKQLIDCIKEVLDDKKEQK